MHRAFKGLYGNRMIQFGNQVSFADNKTRRTWKPNVQVKSMYSVTLQRMLRFRMTTHVMRCVKKAGGIDEYLSKTDDSELKYPKAIELKRDILAVQCEPPGIQFSSSEQNDSSGAHIGPLSRSAPVASRPLLSPSGLVNATGDGLKFSGVHLNRR